jgi:Tfp pilus assembly protein PilV
MKISLKQGYGKGLQAFTLVDAMVGMGVLGVSLLSLFGSFSFGFNVVKLSREDIRATQLIHEKMETIRLYNWTQILLASSKATPFYEGLGDGDTNFFKGQILITNVNFTEAYKADLRQVIVSIDWTNNGVKCSRSVRTLVSHYGLQNYIFQ